jgi:hypothetical protein
MKKVVVIVKGLCLKCWNRTDKKLCERGFTQGDNKTDCRYFSGVK